MENHWGQRPTPLHRKYFLKDFPAFTFYPVTCLFIAKGNLCYKKSYPLYQEKGTGNPFSMKRQVTWWKVNTGKSFTVSVCVVYLSQKILPNQKMLIIEVVTYASMMKKMSSRCRLGYLGLQTRITPKDQCIFFWKYTTKIGIFCWCLVQNSKSLVFLWKNKCTDNKFEGIFVKKITDLRK